MTGLLGYAAAGALAGYGEGIVENAKILREEVQAQRAAEARKAERDQDFERQKEMADYRHELKLSEKSAGSGGGGRKSSGSKAESSGTSTGGEKLVGWSVQDGIAYGRTKSGEMKPYRGPDGQPWREDVKGTTTKTTAPAAINKAPDAMDGAPSAPEQPSGGRGSPKVGSVVEGHRYLGGNPNDANSWEKVSAANAPNTQVAQSSVDVDAVREAFAVLGIPAPDTATSKHYVAEANRLVRQGMSEQEALDNVMARTSSPAGQEGPPYKIISPEDYSAWQKIQMKRF